jgi:hypothetical protein
MFLEVKSENKAEEKTLPLVLRSIGHQLGTFHPHGERFFHSLTSPGSALG